MKHTSSIRRFAQAHTDPGDVIGLSPDHAAVTEGRTLFPTTVIGSAASPRFLVSGHNNPKLGRAVIKGPRAGWPIFQLSLEERATCPRTCERWLDCYGNAMPFARRHAVDENFLPLLRGEVATLARANPNGLLIRLHALGDFYSAEYVLAWGEMLAMFPQLHVFGYTARRYDDPNPGSALTARAIAMLTAGQWERFSIRTSASDPIAHSRAIVVDEDPGNEDTIVCPAQTGATEACATCGLCWASAARDKTIAFLRHGMVRAKGPRAVAASVVATPTPMRERVDRLKRPAGAPPAADAQVDRAIALLTKAGGTDTLSLAEFSRGAEIPKGSMFFVIDRMKKRGLLEVTRPDRLAPATFRLLTPGTAHNPAAGGKVRSEPKARRSESALWEKAEPVAPKPSRPVRQTDLPSEPAPAPVAKAEHAHVFEVLEAPITGAAPGSLLTLSLGMCKWPTNSPPVGEGHLMRFCCKPAAEGEPYCPSHCKARSGRSEAAA
jgi:hypothetical protein